MTTDQSNTSKFKRLQSAKSNVEAAIIELVMYDDSDLDGTQMATMNNLINRLVDVKAEIKKFLSLPI